MNKRIRLIGSALLLCGCAYAQETPQEEPLPVIEEKEPEEEKEPVITEIEYNGNLVHLTMLAGENWHCEESTDYYGQPVLLLQDDDLPEYHFTVYEMEFIGYCGNGLFTDHMDLTGSVQAGAAQYVDYDPLYLCMEVCLRTDNNMSHCMIVAFNDREYDVNTEFDQFLDDWQIAKDALIELLNTAELTYIES